MSPRFALLAVLSLALACARAPEGPSAVDAGVVEVDAGVDAGPAVDAGPPDAGSVRSDVPAPPAVSSVADAACSNGRLLQVYQAVDGDTLSLTNRLPSGRFEHVRLVGVDTPESIFQVECYGPEAAHRTTAVIDGQWICLTYDPAVTAQSNNIDAYDRTLGYVFFGADHARFLNAELVWDGYANDYPFTNGAVFEDYFMQLEGDAYRAQRGMWSACP